MFNYFGSKARLAPTYQAPKHDVIVEPFAGAAAYSMYWLQQRSDMRTVLIDIDPRVVELWNILLSMTPEALWDYPIPAPGTRTTDPIYKTASSGTNGWDSKGPEYQITEWMSQAFAQVRRRMAHTLSKVHGRVTVLGGGYTRAPDLEATWFIDPPYQKEGHRYTSGNRLDFEALGKWTRERTGQVIACEAHGASWLDFHPHASNLTVGLTDSVEVVWYSHPEPTLLDLMA